MNIVEGLGIVYCTMNFITSIIFEPSKFGSAAGWLCAILWVLAAWQERKNAEKSINRFKI